VPNILSRNDLLTQIEKQTTALGLNTHAGSDSELIGDVDKIGAKWWLGGRSVNYRMSCRLTETDHTAHFREAVVEKSWGIPPPTLTVETTTTSGWKRSGTRVDKSIGGGGALNYAQVRDAVEKATTAAGWKFQLEGGRLP